MGHSVRSDKYRYTECESSQLLLGLAHPITFLRRAGVHWDAAADNPDWSQPLLGRELYLHTDTSGGEADFDSYENENMVEDAAHATVVRELSEALRYFFITAQCRKTLCTPEEVAMARRAQGIVA